MVQGKPFFVALNSCTLFIRLIRWILISLSIILSKTTSYKKQKKHKFTTKTNVNNPSWNPTDHDHLQYFQIDSLWMVRRSRLGITKFLSPPSNRNGLGSENTKKCWVWKSGETACQWWRCSKKNIEIVMIIYNHIYNSIISADQHWNKTSITYHVMK